MYWGMNWYWWFFWVVFVLILFGFFATPWGVSGRRRALTALEELQRRYARGEISTEQYEERKARLLRDRTA